MVKVMVSNYKIVRLHKQWIDSTSPFGNVMFTLPPGFRTCQSWRTKLISGAFVTARFWLLYCPELWILSHQRRKCYFCNLFQILELGFLEFFLETEWNWHYQCCCFGK